jgi:signal transduction histidine kinase/DNA-binding response OmpR family regulator
MYVRETQLGFAVFDSQAREAAVYETLRAEISSALESVFLREQIKQAWQKAEEANRLKSRFLATVSHELRTPLSLIVGTIEMMLYDKTGAGAGALPEIVRQDMDCIHGSAQHLAHLIGDVLDLASSHAGELRIASEPLNLGRVLTEVAVLAEPLAREKELNWRAEIPEGPIWVRGDRTRLRQVSLNLVSNAIKFTEAGEVSLQVAAGEGSVTVLVHDTGMGIPAEEHEAIFDEFLRSARSVERGYGGMGLGLAITRRLIEMHGGQVGVSSSGEDGGGSTFYYTLPLLNEAEALPDESGGRRTREVLLLVDHESAAEKLRDHLVGRGFEVSVLAVEKDSDWLARVVEAPPGAVVLDYQPAAERGWELMKNLRENPATRDVPVVFYALNAEDRTGSVLDVGYLTKPVGAAELAQALARLGLEPGTGQAKPTILIADDDGCILDLHTRMIEDALPGCRVLQARDGRAALEMVELERPDLVLLDLMMPEVDGFEVLEAIQDRPMLREIPVLILTAQGLTGEDMARLQGGVAAVLGKDLFRAEEVLAQVEKALARSRRLGSEAQRIVRRAMAFMHEHYWEPVSRASLARALAVSERHLTRCFREEMGIPPVIYLNRYRVRQAKALLERGEMNVTEVAQAVGFSDSNYFGRVFKEEVGVSPGSYQRGRRP